MTDRDLPRICFLGCGEMAIRHTKTLRKLFPEIQVGTLLVHSFPLTPEERLAVSVVAGVLVSLVGVRIAAYFRGATIPEPEIPE